MEIKCKECGVVIEYKREPSKFLFGYQSDEKESQKKTVFLTCDNNHCHPYSVTVED